MKRSETKILTTHVGSLPELAPIDRYAQVVGSENVIVGADCGFGGRSHPQIWRVRS